MKTYVIANQKGGVGKSTTAISMASILKSKGYKVLMIDADQQGNSTDTYRAEFDGVTTLYDVILDNDRADINEAIQHTETGDIVASDPLLRDSELILSKDAEGIYRLQDAFENLHGYDYVIIDTAPSINKLLFGCLTVADELIIPLTADRYSLQGLSQMNEAIQVVKRRFNRNLKISGLLLTKYNPRTNLSKEFKKALEGVADQLGTKVFDTTIRESTKARESQTVRKTLIDYAPKCTTEKDYEDFIEELLKEV